jgi:hypothetical protein
MITRKHFLTFLATSAMTLALVTTGSLVEGKGKPGGGGGASEVSYAVHLIDPPVNGTSFYSHRPFINNKMQVAGIFENLSQHSSVYFWVFRRISG